MNRKITCTNENNVSLCFGSNFAPFLLAEADGLYTFEVDLSLNKRSMGDGSDYIGANLSPRNIVLVIKDKSNHIKNRELLYQLFIPKSKGVLIYEEIDGEYECVRAIDYYVEKLEIDSINRVRTATVSLICNDPYFYALFDEVILMSGWKNFFEFPHEFKVEELGTQKREKLISILNEFSVSHLGMKIIVKAEGNITNPKIYLVENNEYIQIGNDLKPFNMVYGDRLVICTERNKKNAYVSKDSQIMYVDEYIQEGSKYIQLNQGLNTIRYSAKTGEENMLVSIEYRKRFLGV